jgi:hypothetical protein
MIGVIVDTTQHRIVSEFFELFKTPWEFYQSNRRYEVILSVGEVILENNATSLVLNYADVTSAIEDIAKNEATSGKANRMLQWREVLLPIYGEGITFGEDGNAILVDRESGHAAIHQHRSSDGLVIRIGYDLFNEVRVLLTSGQPTTCAAIPTLDHHIALLRDLIISNGIPLIEIPPVPEGYKFITCLTHDVDHPSIRWHKWDHTILGFLRRATFTSLINLFRNRISVQNLLTNWTSALKVPLVYLGFLKDFWRSFDDSYLELEKELSSTFFLIPFRDDPGRSVCGRAPSFRAARYRAADLKDMIGKVIAAGCEIGLHGIDAWCDSNKGRREIEEIRRLTGTPSIGARMHWLYFNEGSHCVLEQAGVRYDSTVGYKETVGYRAGTTQVYKPLDVEQLLELPMHVMDTALFYPAYMGLSQRQAAEILAPLIENVSRLGGCFTINWHDRSLAPERLWDACYRTIVHDLMNRNAWFATAGQATLWFQKRRSVVFGSDQRDTDTVSVNLGALQEELVPGLKLRIYNPGASPTSQSNSSQEYVDIALNQSIDRLAICGTA